MNTEYYIDSNCPSDTVTVPAFSLSAPSFAELLASKTQSALPLILSKPSPKPRRHIFEPNSDEEMPSQETKRVDSKHKVERSKAALLCDREGNQQDAQIYHQDEDEKMGDKEDSERELTSRGSTPLIPTPTASSSNPFAYLHPQPIVEKSQGGKRAHKNKGIKKSKKDSTVDSASGKKVGHKTKNFIAFVYTKFVNYFQKIESVRSMENWNLLRAESPSLTTITALFKIEEMKEGFREMFRSRYLHRQMVLSSAKIRSKKNYIKYLRVLERGFERGKLEYIN